MRPIAIAVTLFAASAFAEAQQATDPHLLVREALAEMASLPAALPQLPVPTSEPEPDPQHAQAATRAAAAAVGRVPSIAQQVGSRYRAAAVRAASSPTATSAAADAQAAAAKARTLTTKPKAPAAPAGPTLPNERPPRP